MYSYIYQMPPKEAVNYTSSSSEQLEALKYTLYG